MKRDTKTSVSTTKARLLSGAPRFVVYLALQIAVFSCGFRYIVAPSIIIVALGLMDRIGWKRWLASSWGLLLFAALPAITGFPWSELGTSTTTSALEAGHLYGAWAPALLRSVRLALVLASAAWLSSGMSPVELREALGILLRPLGKRVSGRVSRSASLTMAFLPWTAHELRRADEAARLRGSNPLKKPLRHLLALSIPLLSRSLHKAKCGAEALTLRDPGFGATT